MDIKARVESDLKLPTGYYVEYGGTFKNLQEASAAAHANRAALRSRSSSSLLFFTFGSIKRKR